MRVTNNSIPTGVPIKPEDISKLQPTTIPYFVINIFNAEIVRHYVDGVARISQEDIIADILSFTGYESRDIIFKNRWLDIENTYRNVGWNVEYEKLGYNERGQSYFSFTHK